ncbi:peptidylprolyl isomerase [Jannaschia sp. R86511]|uniref:peptidylprolyl isomerase n=1 Tax=Jannaschia sp. R86511 TaxID=3093853 RepID=UPI0036D2D27D
MTSKREREYARRRQEKFEQKIAGKEAVRGRSRVRNAVVAGVAVLAVVGAVVAATVWGGPGDGTDGELAADAVASTLPEEVEDTPAAADAATGEAAPPADDTCPPGSEVDPAPAQFDAAPEPVSGSWTVTLATTCGDVTLQLDADAAPQGVGNLVFLAQEGWYDGTPCHRLTTQGIFVLQCGDPTGTGTGGPGYAFGPIENAPADDVYPAGTVAMARVGGDGESMGSQFFLVYEDSTIPSDGAGGYTVLGRVTEGLDIVRLVAEGGLAADGVAPARSIGIDSVTAEETA